MRSLFTYLKTIWPYWIIPLVFYFAALSWLAFKVARTPDNPFIYRI